MANEFSLKGGSRYEVLRVGRGIVFLRNPVSEPQKLRNSQELLGQLYPARAPYEKYQWSATIQGKYHFTETLERSLFGAEPNDQGRLVYLGPNVYANSYIPNSGVGEDFPRLMAPRPLIKKGLQYCGDDLAGLLRNPLGRVSSIGGISSKRVGKYLAYKVPRIVEERRRRLELAKQFLRYVEQREGELPSSPIDMNSLAKELVSIMLKGVAMRSEACAVARSPSPGLEEAMKDINYKAYLRDAAGLSRTYGRCTVAYAGGKRIAVGSSRRDVRAKIPAEYKDTSVLIQEIPERVIRFRRPFRIRREKRTG